MGAPRCGKDKRGRKGEIGLSNSHAEGLALAVRGCWGPQQQERLGPWDRGATADELGWGVCTLGAHSGGAAWARTPWRLQWRGAAGSDLEDPVKGCHLSARFTF